MHTLRPTHINIIPLESKRGEKRNIKNQILLKNFCRFFRFSGKRDFNFYDFLMTLSFNKL